MEYIIIDGDDIGRRITSCYITNDEVQLAKISTEMSNTVIEISQLLQEAGYQVIFCAADGVVGMNPNRVNLKALFDRIQVLAPRGVTFSAGTGGNLQQAYLALTHAKCSGKNLLIHYELISKDAN
jgi:hypothetical protein